MKTWLIGIRPRTLPAAVAPVAVGSAVSWPSRWEFRYWHAAAALAVAILLQIGVNLANDYSDGVRGTDDDRVGPPRLVGSGLKPAGAVKRAAYLAFGLAAVIGTVLSLATAWWLLLVGIACVLAGWYYTGGSNPYGYLGLGEVFVFVFFGLVATIGSDFVQHEGFAITAVVVAVPVGFLATALLVVNNLRDIPGDTQAGKRTLAVRLGDARTRQFYVALLVASFVLVVPVIIDRPAVALVALALPLAVGPVQAVRRGAEGRDLIPVLAGTGRLQLVFGLLLACGLVLSSG